MLNRIFVLAPLLVVLAACTLPQPVTTRSLTGTQTTPINGVVYSLPRTIIRIKTANMETAISSAEHVADPTRSYILEGQHRFASNDNFDFSIENGLLSSLTVNSQDEVPTVVKRTVSAIGGVLSGVNADRIKGTDSEQARDQVFISTRWRGQYKRSWDIRLWSHPSLMTPCLTVLRPVSLMTKVARMPVFACQ